MKRLALFISCLFGTVLVLGPRAGSLLAQPVAKVHARAVERPDTLARRLTAGLTTELEKTRALFRWVAQNISYRSRPLPARTDRTLNRVRAAEPVDTVLEALPLNERVAYQVLKDREAVCDGYARLFKTLCDYAGIQSEVVTGYVRSNINRPGSFRSNHSWNAVRIDSVWHLADPTWASGYFTYFTDQFVQVYDDFFFLTPPDQLIRTHFPEDVRWTLLDKLPAVSEFQRTPFKCMAFDPFKIVRFFPAQGIIDAQVGDTVRIELETVDRDKRLMVYTGLPVDSARFSITIPDSLVRSEVEGPRIRYAFRAEAEGEDWLNVVYNNYTVLRYRLRVRRAEEAKVD